MTTLITRSTKAKGALFKVKDQKQNGPIMTGNFEVGDQKLSLAAFFQTSKETNRDYLNLKLTDGERSLYGRLFRAEKKSGEKSPDYTGYLEITTTNSEESSPELRVAGWKTQGSNQAYISLVLEPMVKPGSSADDTELPI